MAVSTDRDVTQALIDRYVDANPHGRGAAEARLKDYGTSVWALVGYYLHAVGRDAEQVAHDYHLPREVVEAALAYYRRHQALIDARLLLNNVDVEPE
jgi:uncharacterized protein (DUF433 family)